MASSQEIVGGGYQVAIQNGWNKLNNDLWMMDPNQPNMEEIQYESPQKKAAICFKDKE